jgi:hypothetical protein
MKIESITEDDFKSIESSSFSIEDVKFQDVQYPVTVNFAFLPEKNYFLDFRVLQYMFNIVEHPGLTRPPRTGTQTSWYKNYKIISNYPKVEEYKYTIVPKCVFDILTKIEPPIDEEELLKCNDSGIDFHDKEDTAPNTYNGVEINDYTVVNNVSNGVEIIFHKRKREIFKKFDNSFKYTKSYYKKNKKKKTNRTQLKLSNRTQ